jgi:anti-sigma-K factor RskA
MTPFEDQLRQAMARREPPADFTKRVLERIEQQERRKARAGAAGWFRAWRLAAAAAALLAVGGSVFYQQRERAARGEAAKQKLLIAVRIAGAELHQVHRRVLEVEAMEVSQ